RRASAARSSGISRSSTFAWQRTSGSAPGYPRSEREADVRDLQVIEPIEPAKSLARTVGTCRATKLLGRARHLQSKIPQASADGAPRSGRCWIVRKSRIG